MKISPFLSRRLLRSLFAFGIFVAFILIQQWQMQLKPVPTGTLLAGSALTASSSTPTVAETQIHYSGTTTRPVQCFGKEASHHTKDLVEGKVVLLIDDPKADDRDKYGRWLRNVVRKDDSLDLNATLVAEGYANAYLSFPLDGKRKAQIRQLEQEAKINERGLWSPSTCEGKK